MHQSAGATRGACEYQDESPLDTVDCRILESCRSFGKLYLPVENRALTTVKDVYVRSVYHAHRTNQTILEDEPKKSEALKLTRSVVTTSSARSSILEYNGILITNDKGIAKPGEEKGDLDATSGALQADPTQEQFLNSRLENYATCPVLAALDPEHQVQQVTQSQQAPLQQYRQRIPSPQSDGTNRVDYAAFDAFNPFLEPGMLNLLSDEQMQGLFPLDTNMLNLEDLEFHMEPPSLPTS